MTASAARLNKWSSSIPELDRVFTRTTFGFPVGKIEFQELDRSPSVKVQSDRQLARRMKIFASQLIAIAE
jgi:hypothetical protein